MSAHIPPRALRPGTVVTVQMKGLFKLAHHFALVSGKTGADGMPMVIANSGETRGPGEVSWSEFVKGREYRAFYPSTLPPKTVLSNAYAMFGTRYDFPALELRAFRQCLSRPPRAKPSGTRRVDAGGADGRADAGGGQGLKIAIAAAAIHSPRCSEIQRGKAGMAGRRKKSEEAFFIAMFTTISRGAILPAAAEIFLLGSGS